MAESFPLVEIPDAVRAIAKRLRDAGFQAFFVGGAVRDRLIARAPDAAPPRVGDFDIATSATPDAVQALFQRTVPVGIEHGTVAVLDGQGGLHEVTTFRRDVRTDGRHAEVAFGVSLEEDLARRDFTINAIAVDSDSGVMHDPHGGRADLAAGVVRAVGDPAARFREDRLRVIRALRFAAVLGFTIEPATWAAVTDAAGDLEHLSRERVRDEWFKMLAGAAPSAGLSWWGRAGVRDAVWPELVALQPEDIASLDDLPGRDPVLVTAAALARAGVAPAVAEAAARRLRFATREATRIAAIVTGLADPLPGPTEGAVLRRWIAARLPWSVDVVAAAGRRAPQGTAEAVRATLSGGAALSVDALAIGGDDLLAMGVPAGPGLGILLRQLLDDVLEAPERNTRPWLLARARELA